MEGNWFVTLIEIYILPMGPSNFQPNILLDHKSYRSPKYLQELKDEKYLPNLLSLTTFEIKLTI